MPHTAESGGTPGGNFGEAKSPPQHRHGKPLDLAGVTDHYQNAQPTILFDNWTPKKRSV
jgi:hypothetical protein